MKNIAMVGCVLAALGPARAFADLNFDATTVEPDAGYDVLPVGWYNAAIDESEMKPTSSGTGTYLKLRFNILDGQYAGRKVYTQLNLKNENPQTVEIAQKQLSAICHAVGVLKPSKSEELHGLPLKIKLKYVAATGQYSEKNEIASYKSKDEAVDMAGGDAGAAAFGAGAPTPPAQPWSQGAATAAAETPATNGAPAQPWAGVAPNTAAPPPPVPPVAPPPPPAAHDPIAAAVADGWIKHPSAPGYHYKGQTVMLDGEVAALYPAPAPEVPAAPPTPTVPSAPVSSPAPAPVPDAAAAQAAPPPWAKPA